MKVNQIWTTLDRALSTLCLFVIALLLGAFFQATVRDYFWFLVIALILLLIKPAYSYWRWRERRRGAEAAISMQDRH